VIGVVGDDDDLERPDGTISYVELPEESFITKTKSKEVKAMEKTNRVVKIEEYLEPLDNHQRWDNAALAEEHHILNKKDSGKNTVDKENLDKVEKKSTLDGAPNWSIVRDLGEKIQIHADLVGESITITVHKKNAVAEALDYEKNRGQKSKEKEEEVPVLKGSLQDQIFELGEKMSKASKEKNYSLLRKLMNQRKVLEKELNLSKDFKDTSEKKLDPKQNPAKEKKEVKKTVTEGEDGEPRHYATAYELNKLINNLGWKDEKLLTFFQMNNPQKLIFAAKRNQMFSEADREEAIKLGFENEVKNVENKKIEEPSSLEETKEPVSYESFDLNESDKEYQELVGRNFKEPFPQHILNSIAQKIHDGYKLTSAEKTLYSYTEIKDEVDTLRETIQETRLEGLDRNIKKTEKKIAEINKKIELKKMIELELFIRSASKFLEENKIEQTSAHSKKDTNALMRLVNDAQAYYENLPTEVKEELLVLSESRLRICLRSHFED
jgi:hypothetical protein